jgi:glucan phosphoethanolaminetransferase (alkaline phosphatase superfamily)
MYNEELHKKTKELYQKLNHFMIHVIIYFVVNFGIIYFVFQDISERWGLFFIAIVWAILVIYHALMVSGIDFLKRHKRIKSFIWGA